MRLIHIALVLCIQGCYLSHTNASVDAGTHEDDASTSVVDASIEDAAPTTDAAPACVLREASGEFSFGPNCFGEDRRLGDSCCATGAPTRAVGSACVFEGRFVGWHDPASGHLSVDYVFEGERYVMARREVLISWLGDIDHHGVPVETLDGRHVCTQVLGIPVELLTAIPLRRRLPLRPGVLLLRLESDSQLYVLTRRLLYRRISREAAEQIYGLGYERRIHVIPDAFFIQPGSLGPEGGSAIIEPDVEGIEDYDPVWEASVTLEELLRLPD